MGSEATSVGSAAERRSAPPARQAGRVGRKVLIFAILLIFTKIRKLAYFLILRGPAEKYDWGGGYSAI